MPQKVCERCQFTVGARVKQCQICGHNAFVIKEVIVRPAEPSNSIKLLYKDLASIAHSAKVAAAKVVRLCMRAAHRLKEATRRSRHDSHDGQRLSH